jgi:hypothetical protein
MSERFHRCHAGETASIFGFSPQSSTEWVNIMDTNFDRSVRVRLVFAFLLISLTTATGQSQETSGPEDLFVFGENESAQVFYDEKENVYAISIDFTGRNNDAPTARAVLNEDIAAREDGSMYRLKQYADAGYWVSYNRTNSDPPQITITMQKIPH